MNEIERILSNLLIRFLYLLIYGLVVYTSVNIYFHFKERHPKIYLKLRKPSVVIFKWLFLPILFPLFLLSTDSVQNIVIVLMFLQSLIILIIGSLMFKHVLEKPLNKMVAEMKDMDKLSYVHTDTKVFELEKLGKLTVPYSLRYNKKIKYITTMTSDFYHDIKNPLSAIKLSCELLQDSELTDENITGLENSINRLDDIIQQMSLTPIDDIIDPDYDDKNSFINVVAVIGESIEIIKQKNNGVDITFENLLSSNFFYKMLKVHLTRIVQNLTDNAASFGNQVLVRLYKKDNSVIISVEDNGPGVKEEDKEKIFSYAYSSRKNKDSGHSGIGLATVKTIVKFYDGKIEVEKSEELKGAKFIVSMPLEEGGTKC